MDIPPVIFFARQQPSVIFLYGGSLAEFLWTLSISRIVGWVGSLEECGQGLWGGGSLEKGLSAKFQKRAKKGHNFYFLSKWNGTF